MKKKLTVDEQIEDLKSKGVKFEIKTEDEAQCHLVKNGETFIESEKHYVFLARFFFFAI